MWQDTLDAEFGGGKFKCLFRGPMCSGCDRKDIGNPRKVIKNLFIDIQVHSENMFNHLQSNTVCSSECKVILGLLNN